MPSKKEIDFDPYQALGLQHGATDADITKAYRKLALKFHPDKQSSKSLSPAEMEALEQRFHDIKEARTFLLENKEEREKYDLKRASEQKRREAEAQREETMSAQRKQMRDALLRKEQEAKQAHSNREASHQSATKKRERDNLVDQLRREGTKLREEYAQREAAKQAEQEVEQEYRKQKKELKEQLENRQVRLKWDRKKIRISPSEDSIAQLFEKERGFGTVESVEILGSKGNQALVTFADASSCRPCVEFYKNSKEMRAKFVGARKEQEEELELQREREREEAELRAQKRQRSSGRENETLEDRRLRQKGEREALLRQMEQEEEQGGDGANGTNGTGSRVAREHATSASLGRNDEKDATPRPTISFPLEFPKEFLGSGKTPRQILEEMERRILGDFLTEEELKSMQVGR